MTFDYFEALAHQRYDLQDCESATAHYHFMISNDQKDSANNLRERWQEIRLGNLKVQAPALHTQLNIPDFDITIFPTFTLWLQFPFRLTKAYLSKDDRDFYIVDNPIRRDKVFQLPYVAPTSWKGNLRAALWNLGYEENTLPIRRLFGNERASEKHFCAGRLHFFPTFFRRQSLEIINPHDHNRRVGKNPILFECVPPGTPGVFSLLYVPFDRVGGDERETRNQVAEDLALLAQGIPAMFCTYGFGAKTSSGFGTAVDTFVNKRDQKREHLPAGQIQLKAILREPEALSNFQNSSGPITDFTPAEWEALLNDREILSYQAACAAYERHQQNIALKQIGGEIGSFHELSERLLEWSSRLPLEVQDEP